MPVDFETLDRPAGYIQVHNVTWLSAPTGRKLDPRVERMLFALVANRALEPGSKLAGARWVTRRTHVDGPREVSDDACYRAMDWLLDIAPELEKQVFWQVAVVSRRQRALLR